jgi:hypothetical protein
LLLRDEEKTRAAARHLLRAKKQKRCCVTRVCASQKLSHSLADLWIARRADVLHANGCGKIVSRRSLDKGFKGKVY